MSPAIIKPTHSLQPTLLFDIAATEDFDYLIVRPGRLVGGPWTNTDVSNLLKVEEGTRKRVVVERGDALNGDAARISVVELVVRVSIVRLVCRGGGSIGMNYELTTDPVRVFGKRQPTGAGPAGRHERGAVPDQRRGRPAERRRLGRALSEAGLRD